MADEIRSIRFWVISIVGIVSAAASASWAVSQYMGNFDRNLTSIRDELTLFQFRIGRDERLNSEAIARQRARLTTLGKEVENIQMELTRDLQQNREDQRRRESNTFKSGGSP